MVQKQGGREYQTGGILRYLEDLIRAPNAEFGPKDFFAMGSTWVARHSLLARALGIERLHAGSPSKELSIRPQYSRELSLFDEIIKMTAALGRRHGFQLTLVLLPGRSYIERQGSLSYQVQAYLGKEIIAFSKSQSIPVIDIAVLLEQRYNQAPGDWFFKNEGHLTPEGHRVVAGLINQWMVEKGRG